MPAAKPQDPYEITWLIRRVFRALAARADQYLAESGLTAAERAVLEFLHPDQALSVPAIARRYDVSRQHIQVTVNGLIDKGLVRRGENPRHKRSALIRLTGEGQNLFVRIRDNEAQIITALFAGITDPDLEATHRTLRTLYTNLK